MTFSIVARDGSAFGVAVASKFLAVGAVVPAARLGTGAVATQSYARVAYITELLSALARGESASRALAAATAQDAGAALRQVGVVGKRDAATFTGSQCLPWAGGLTGEAGGACYAIQGNLLMGPEVVAEMERAFLAAARLPFGQRLLESLLAGDAAGGDARGRESAALYAVAPGTGYDRSGVLADLRVDNHPEAPTELARIYDLHDLYFGMPHDPQQLVGDLELEVRGLLDTLGITGGATADDLARWASTANLENRLSATGIDARVLSELRRAHQAR
ncbi:DUF1028 domain-containing protein [Nostocoides sp.]|uniref:DUF1028 domain-containing protein n=3 Tax=Nostocoides sp. TaxID=1917966 RepID=UPI002BD7A582|nr:DUF1028 domain-containing protein [Tetrasphaera sp.]